MAGHGKAPQRRELRHRAGRRPGGRVLLQGWIEGRRGGTAVPQRRSRPRPAASGGGARDFRPVALRATFSADFAVAHSSATSRNVLGGIRAPGGPDEIVMFGAHWDAYGVGAPDARAARSAPARTTMPRCRRAARNRAPMKQGPRPQRTASFGFLERRGTRAARVGNLCQNPVYPAAKTVANMTLDILQTGGRSRDVMLVGNGKTAWRRPGHRCGARTARHSRSLPRTRAILSRRSFSARQGCPDSVDHGDQRCSRPGRGWRAGGRDVVADYMKCYHQACDE